MGAIISKCLPCFCLSPPQSSQLETPIPPAQYNSSAIKAAGEPHGQSEKSQSRGEICQNRADSETTIPADLWQWHDTKEDLDVDPNEVYPPKLIFSCKLDELSGKCLDITPYATPCRYRLLSLTSLRYRGLFQIYEFDELPMYSEILPNVLKNLNIPGFKLPEMSHCCAASYVWRGVAVNADPSLPSAQRAKEKGDFTVMGGEDGDPISISVLNDICWAATAGNGVATFLWLDQLSILQSSKEDKAWQIQRMYHIYSTSTTIALPGGLGRLASLDDETTWMDRAWTLQEVLAPNGAVLTLFAKDNVSDSDLRGLKEVEYYSEREDATSIVAIASLFDLLDRSRNQNRTIFGFQSPQVTALLDARAGRSETSIWQCAIMRTSSRPVDMIFSIMHLLGVSLDPKLFESDDRVGATIALARGILEKQNGQASWLGGLWFLPPSPEISIFPQFPETRVDGKAIIRMPDGSSQGVVSLMSDMQSLTTWTYHSSSKYGDGEVDNDGYYTFTAGEVIPLKLAKSVSGIESVPWYISRNICLNGGDGSVWHPISRDGRPEFEDYPDHQADGLAVGFGQLQGEDHSLIYLVLKKHGEGKYHRVTHIVSPWWDARSYWFTEIKLSVGPVGGLE
ncbi:hypothetical protein Moror_7660 [Moniliophthora roreri MCA 2997]|uniref:Heterokaryon incompatibility domain-containing protein n=1 Tax=Moniliophthora roreri (strain MCA 2997) TaxID=1381753 RepID=V2X955_MONRO|nr:hypothetical protein Moror_7660 [Moniliophthora roreri MCA 2997]